MYLLLILSFFSLLLGPLLCSVTAKYDKLVKFLDAFVLCSIVSLVVFHVLPESIEKGGALAVLTACVGLFGPMFLSQLFNQNHCQVHRSLISIASLGLLSHALLDGFALANSSVNASGEAISLGLAVVLHRLPEGVGIWRVTQSNLGRKAGYVVLGLVAFSTWVGFAFGESILTHTSETVLTSFEALMGGVLLHVIFHQHHLIQLNSQKSEKPLTFPSAFTTGAGAFCGFLLVIGLSFAHSSEHHHDEPTPEIALDHTKNQDIICSGRNS